jgi:hypothetical protein
MSTQTMNPNTIHALANPHGSTGPRTGTGKARSSRNATKNGLFTTLPFICDGEAEEYAQTQASLMAHLSPEGVLEEAFATEIMSATWRLRRCRLVEENITGAGSDDSVTKEQNSLNRARAQAHNTLRRSLAELRKLQTERTVRRQLPAHNLNGLTDTRHVLDTLRLQDKQRLDSRKADGLDSLEALIHKADKDLGMKTTPGHTELSAPQTVPGTSFCKTTAAVNSTLNQTPRNATCPCGSGIKYKRCCGKQAPPVLNAAA